MKDETDRLLTGVLCAFLLGMGAGGGMIRTGLFGAVQAKADDSAYSGRWSGVVETITDRETGCQYVVVDAKGITPRMGSDHQQVCIKGAKP